MKKLLLAIGLLLALPCAANAAACSTNAFAKAAGNFSNTTAVWATTSGGSTFCTLTAGNNIIFDSLSGSGTYNIDETISVANFDTTGTGGSGSPPSGITLAYSGAFTLTITGTIFNWSHLTLTSAPTRQLTFGATSGTTTITTGGNTLPAVTFNGAGGTFTLADTFTMNGSALTLTNGILDNATNNVAVTATAGNFSVQAGTKTLHCGTNTWTFGYAGGGSAWDSSTNATGLTLDCASGTLTFNQATLTGYRTFVGSGQSFGNVIVYGGTIEYPFAFSGTMTLASLTLNAPVYIQFAINNTYTITTVPSWAGTSTAYIGLGGYAGGSANIATIALSGNPSLKYVSLQGLTFTGTSAGCPSLSCATNSIDLGHNVGITITPPSSGHIIGG